MPNLIQLEAWVKQQIAKGKGELHTNHVVIVEEESERRQRGGVRDESGKLPTRIVWDSGDNQMYCEWHRERERWMRLGNKNPCDVTAAMIIGLRLFSDEQILDIISNLQRVGEPHEPSESR
jgi:hypothetical protein